MNGGYLGNGRFSTLTIPYTGQPDVTLTRGYGGSAAVQSEPRIVVNYAEANALVLQNNATNGYGAAVFATHLGKEVGSIGWCNTSAGVYPGAFLVEAGDFEGATSGVGPRFVLGQFSNFGAGGAAYHQPKITFETSGNICFWSNGGLNAGQPVGTIEQATGKVSFGLDSTTPEFLFDPTGGASNLYLQKGTTPTLWGNGQLYTQADAHHSIHFREGGNARVSYYSFGGSLSSAAGHKFYTGGLIGSQTVRLQIADDGIVQMTPAAAPSDASLFAGSVAIWVNESTNSLTFKVKYSGGTVKSGTVALI